MFYYACPRSSPFLLTHRSKPNLAPTCGPHHCLKPMSLLPQPLHRLCRIVLIVPRPCPCALPRRSCTLQLHWVNAATKKRMLRCALSAGHWPNERVTNPPLTRPNLGLP